MATTAQLAQLAQAVYADTGAPSGWERRGNSQPNPSGYFGAVFRNDLTGEIVIAHRGTEPTSGDDLYADLQMGLRKVPDQYQYAQEFLEQVESAYQDAPLSITGHSLGGAIAQLQGAQTGLTTVTFNPYGAGTLLPEFVTIYGDQGGHIAAGDFSNIQNYQTAFDGVSRLPGSTQIGPCRIEAASSEVPAMSVALASGNMVFVAAAMFVWSHSIARFTDEIYNNPFQPSAWSTSFIAFAQQFGSEINGIEQSVSTLFTAAGTYQRQNVATQVWFRYDPLILDLDGDGLETHGIDAAHPIYFDHTGDGTLNPSGWVADDDGFLVLDRNGNGQIDNGTELFGDSTPLAKGGQALNGFHALAQEDTNEDGWVDAQDARFGELRVWRDLDQDGVSDAGELLSLEDLGIHGFRVEATPNYQLLDNGNVLADVGSYLRSDGSQADMGTAEHLGDVDLASDTFRRRFDDAIPLAEQAQALPEMQGSGKVRDLREAANEMIWRRTA